MRGIINRAPPKKYPKDTVDKTPLAMQHNTSLNPKENKKKTELLS